MLKKSIPFAVTALLLVLALAWDNFSQKSFTNSSVAKQTQKNLDRELSLLETEVKKISVGPANFNWSSLHYSFYLIDSGKIISWSHNNLTIDIADLEGDFKLRLLQKPRTDLLLYKFSSGERSLVGILPLRTGYEIVNRYLTTSWNDQVFPIQGLKIFSLDDKEGSPVCSAKQGCLFKVQIPDGVYVENRISLMITLLAILVALFGIYFIVVNLHRERNYFTAFLVMFFFLSAIRIAMVQFLFPARWMYSPYFDPKYFASSSFNASVGDFFLNALIVAMASGYLFKIYSRLGFIRRLHAKDGSLRVFISILLLAGSFFSFLFPHLFVESIFHDSAISIDISSGVGFDGLMVMALGALVLGCLSSFFFVHFFVRWTAFLLKSPWEFLFCLLMGALLFTGYFLFSELNYWSTLFVGVPFFIVLYFSRHFRFFSVTGYKAFSFLLIVLIAYATLCASGIRRFAQEREIRSMLRSAGNLINNDVLGEYLLNETIKKIKDDKFIVASLESPLIEKKMIRQKVRLVHLNSYFDRYEVKINLYYPDGSPVDDESESFVAFIKPMMNAVNKTNDEGIYFIRSTASEIVKRYLAVVPIKSKILLGYVVLDLSSKQIVPQQVYPELLIDNRFSQSLRNKSYSYAFFRQKHLIGSIGSFNFNNDSTTRLLNNPLLYSTGIEFKGNWLVGSEDETGRQAIVSTEVYPVFFSLANFSFLFVLGIGLIFLSLIIFLTARWRRSLDLTYSARIQLYIYLSFMLPLIVVSTIALRMISQADEAQLEKEVREKGLKITESIGELMDPSLADSAASYLELQKKMVEVSQSTLTDANLYAPSGKLIASSQPAIFTSQLIMPLEDRASWEKIVNQNSNIAQVRCQIGRLDYYSLFFAIRSPGKNQLNGTLELPFFQSNSTNTKVNVLANILVTFTIVFILFSFLTFSAINRLTSPLRFIAKKLKTTSLGDNKPIEWNANDEIGLMVKEYNRMLSNLERNKIDLARSQKESAWREIAQQVAHEIRNPLTPMKLTLQQLEQSLASAGADQERIKKSVQTLLAQVEILNGIASSFNSFASMPAPVLAKVEIVSLLKNLIVLFENQSKGLIQFETVLPSMVVLGDEQLLVRIFSNLLLNGIQSGNGEEVNIMVSLAIEGDGCIAKFSDNGSGIALELREKIFLPHFTTKQSGSGLGLAIAKHGIEQMGGAIWFETKEGHGTTFYVRLKKL